MNNSLINIIQHEKDDEVIAYTIINAIPAINMIYIFPEQKYQQFDNCNCILYSKEKYFIQKYQITIKASYIKKIIKFLKMKML